MVTPMGSKGFAIALCSALLSCSDAGCRSGDGAHNSTTRQSSTLSPGTEAPQGLTEPALTREAAAVQAATLSPDRTRLYVIWKDSAILGAFKLPSLRRIHRFVANDERLRNPVIAVSDDGQWLSLAASSVFAVWNTTTWERVAVDTDLVLSSAIASKFLADNRHILVRSVYAAAYLVDLTTGKTTLSYYHYDKVPQNRGLGVALSDDQRWGVVTDPIGPVHLWNLETHTSRALPRADKGATAVFRPGGDLFALSRGDGSVELWSASRGMMLRTLAGKGVVGAYRRDEGPSDSMAFSSDGRTLVVALDGCHTRVWDVSNPTKPPRVDHAHVPVDSSVLSTCRAVVAAGARKLALVKGTAPPRTTRRTYGCATRAPRHRRLDHTNHAVASSVALAHHKLVGHAPAARRRHHFRC